MKISSNDADDSNNENIFRHKLLLIKTQLLRLRKAFTNSLSAKIKLPKTQLHKIEQSKGFWRRILGPLLKNGLLLMKNVLKTLAKSFLIPLGLTAAASATDAALHKKMFGSGMKTLIFFNEEMNDIMKIVKSYKESGLLRIGISETTENEAK